MDFISFSLNYWEDLWQSRHQVMEALSRRHKVLFCSPPIPLSHAIGPRNKSAYPDSGLVERKLNLYTYVFPRWLFENYRSERLEELMWTMRCRLVRGITRRLGFEDTVLFLWHPRYVGLLGRFGESVACYYVDDDFSGYAGVSPAEQKKLGEQEDAILRTVDVAFANGPALLASRQKYGNALNLPMGVEFPLYVKGGVEETPVFPDLASLPAPRVGHIGNLNDKIDFVRLAQIARARPHWSVVLVGPAAIRQPEFRAHFEELKALPNVHLLGLKPREVLPNYVRGLDVCLMCYRVEGWARFIYPLKLHEYLASGKPVVGSDLESLHEFSSIVRIAHGPEEWVRAIELSLSERDPMFRQQRIEVARQNSLDVRVEAIERAIQGKLEGKKRAPGPGAMPHQKSAEAGSSTHGRKSDAPPA